ncbi:MAG: type II toxin-antitoxin system Phd/YefM family antitoxin [Thermomicrobiales bacterium]
MVKTISARDARANFSDLLGSVYFTKDPVMIERNGKPVVVMINPDDFAHFQAYVREQAWSAITRIRERNADKDPETVLHDVGELVAAVRQERHAPKP